MKYKRDTPTDMNEQFNQIMAWLLIQNTRLNVITTIKLKLLRGRDRDSYKARLLRSNQSKMDKEKNIHVNFLRKLVGSSLLNW